MSAPLRFIPYDDAPPDEIDAIAWMLDSLEEATAEESRTEDPASARAPNVQGAPVTVGYGESAVRLKVDAAYRVKGALVVAGWASGPLELGVMTGAQNLEVRRFGIPRPDVAAHFQAAGGEALGFVLVAHTRAVDPIRLTWRILGEALPRQSQPLRVTAATALPPGELQAIGPALALVALWQPPHTREWEELVSKVTLAPAPAASARGFLEAAAASVHTGGGAVVGWVVHTPGAVVWLEDDAGRTYSLERAFRRFRQDVHDAVGQDFGHASRDAGFVLHAAGMKPGARIRLKALTEAGVHVLGETVCGNLPADPVAAARWLFAVATPLGDMHRRVPLVDEPVLGRLLEHRQAIWDELPVTVRQVGRIPAEVEVSVIVPLYGRADFVEHQLVEFCRDPWFVDRAELIYVLDDPRLVEGFGALADELHRLYRVPFRWVWGSANRGFSGANNLGAAHSSAATLVFLNSDAFPERAGWARELAEALKGRADVGAVGPRLVYGDGGIQHAGMEFRRRDDLGIWVNHHPRMGLDPSLDPHHGLTIVPAVTGACLALRRSDFDRVGGWDTGYLIGDFEDSDLCLKLRAEGLRIGYLPGVQLTHLERQSFKLLGQDEFRTRVVIYNAVRHQTRWSRLIDEGTKRPVEPALS